MKKTHFTWDNISSALYAVASSILTSALYDELSSVSYLLQETRQGRMAIPIGELGLGTKILIIGALFLAIWLTMWILFSVIPRTARRIKYRNIEPLSQQQIISQFKSAKQTILSLQNSAVNPLLYADELATAIRSLYMAFCPSRPELACTVKVAFRIGDMADDIDQYISPYDYQALIDEAEKLVSRLRGKDDGSDELLHLDCAELSRRIRCLREAPGAGLRS